MKKTDKKNAAIEIKTHSAALQITHKISLIQHKAWLVLLRNAYSELNNPQVKKHKIRVSELCQYLGMENTNHKQMKSLLEELVNITVKWNYFGKDGKGVWGAASLLAGCKVKDGIVKYDYSEFLKEQLHHPRIFALLNLGILNRFNSRYSMALYNLCKDYVGVGKSPYMEIEKFREFMGLEEDEYCDFRRLNVRVIKDPMKEINNKSDIQVAVEYKKESKGRVYGLQFSVKETPQLALNLETTLETIDKEIEQLPSVTGDKKGDGEIIDVETSKDVPDSPLFTRLLSYGISRNQVEKFMNDLDESYISEVLAVVEEDRKADKVRDLAAYTVRALKEDYRSKVAPIEEKEKKVKKARRESLEKVNILKELYENFKRDYLQEKLKGLSSAKKKKIEKEFVGWMNEGSNGKVLLPFYEKEGLDHVAIRGAFANFAWKQLIEGVPPVKDFVSYIAGGGIEVSTFREELKGYPF